MSTFLFRKLSLTTPPKHDILILKELITPRFLRIGGQNEAKKMALSVHFRSDNDRDTRLDRFVDTYSGQDYLAVYHRYRPVFEHMVRLSSRISVHLRIQMPQGLQIQGFFRFLQRDPAHTSCHMFDLPHEKRYCDPHFLYNLQCMHNNRLGRIDIEKANSATARIHRAIRKRHYGRSH
jgi:hypothetical protein